jgi:ribosomal protein L37AE/L43A
VTGDRAELEYVPLGIWKCRRCGAEGQVELPDLPIDAILLYRAAHAAKSPGCAELHGIRYLRIEE